MSFEPPIGFGPQPRIPRVEPSPDRMKKCSTPGCGWWPITSYQRDKNNPDLHRNQCKACRQERRSQLRKGARRLRPWQLRRCHVR